MNAPFDPRDAIHVLSLVDVTAPPEVHAAAALLPIVDEFRVSSSSVADLRADLAAGKVGPEQVRDRLYAAAIDVEPARRFAVANDVVGPIVDRARTAIAARGDVIFDRLRVRFDEAVAVFRDACVPAPPPPPTWTAMRPVHEVRETPEVDTARATARSVIDARRLLARSGWGPRVEDVAWYIAHPGDRTRIIEAGRVWVNPSHPRSITALIAYGFDPRLSTLDEVEAILTVRGAKPGVRRRNRLPEAPAMVPRVPVVR